jgi:hypothetical protein
LIHHYKDPKSHLKEIIVTEAIKEWAKEDLFTIVIEVWGLKFLMLGFDSTCYLTLLFAKGVLIGQVIVHLNLCYSHYALVSFINLTMEIIV